MAAGDRFKSWIEGNFKVWQANIKTFIFSLFGPLGMIFWNMFRSQIETETKANLQAIADDPNTSPEIRAIVLEGITSVNTGGEVMAWILTIFGTLISIIHLGGPQGRNMSYVQDRKIKSFRLDPLSIVTAWRRDPGKYAGLFSDLDDQGWDDLRQEVLKFVTEFIPSADEQTLWLAREVFEKDMVDKYGLDDELPVYEDTDFSKVGVTREQMTNKWRAHWVHASWQQIVEMLHRGLITEADVWEWFRLVEIPPFWRQLLIDSAYTWPTRVDVRRWWDMRTIDEARLRELYSGMGYRGQNLEDYIKWTKVYTDFPMMMSRFRNGWITEDGIRQWLLGLDIPAERVEQFIQEKTKPESDARVEEGRTFTKSEIYKGVRNGVITPEQGIELIMDLGYSEDEADYLLTINVEALKGSPENFDEFKAITSKYQKAVGREVKPMSEEMRNAGKLVVKLTGEIDALHQAIKLEEDGLILEDGTPPAATKELKKMQVALHRAEAELARANAEFSRLKAVFIHGA